MTINKIFPKAGDQRKIIEIEIDGLFSSLLLYKKKKYAAMVVDNYEELLSNVENWKNLHPTEKLEIKGLDMVRRDWSGLTKTTGTEILRQVLMKGDRDSIVEGLYSRLEQLMKDLDRDKIHYERFVIHRVLTMNLAKYKSIDRRAHV